VWDTKIGGNLRPGGLGNLGYENRRKFETWGLGVIREMRIGGNLRCGDLKYFGTWKLVV
jgi:hypothetical protein